MMVFLLAGVMSFSTGTSWGPMGVVMPLAIPVALELTQWELGQDLHPVVISTIGSVLAGAVFGDHCSPISDTTIVSSFASSHTHCVRGGWLLS
ncbi:MAG: Na+/H+ antiporter NhaC family protein, partial [Limisphaerales bacterium]